MRQVDLARIGMAIFFATLAVGIALMATLSGGEGVEGVVWGRDTRSMAAVVIGASVSVTTTALLLGALLSVVFVFLPVRRGPLRIIGAWAAGLICGAIALFGASMTSVFAMSAAYRAPHNVPDSAIGVAAFIASWVALFVMFVIGLPPSQTDGPAG